MAPEVEVINYERFRPYIVGSARLETVHTGMRWPEGPVYCADGDYYLWSDIPNNRIMRWVEGGARRLTRTEPDGTITVLADHYQGKRLNSPNDVVVRSDGTIWFTDPDYGILSDYTGDKAQSEIGINHVFCYDPASGTLTGATDKMVKPNGLAFSPDETILYVADTSSSHSQTGYHHIEAWDVVGKELRNQRVFAVINPGVSDGFRVDIDGNVWTSAGDGVQVFAPDGELIGKIRLPEVCTNLVFGGPKRNRLFMTCAASVFTLYVSTRGAQYP
ncbi:MAG: SMP-30/gluconolactonase/LRE family protein [Rhizobiales bacterium]|nr:SMP-30/gluconolactonase/LRE family protein [Hyphomicrobiales bacterium]